tara:strand:+ start:688 stop:1353 length:666 start_codon:yes stop_codon:yes gene_type:complete
MKLLIENWREYLNEMEEEVIDTLRIFDFDETIAHTRSSTRVTAPDGSQAVLSNQKEFEDYMTAAAEKEGLEAFDPVEGLMAKGYEIDLSDFSQVIEPEEITVVTDQLRQNPHNAKNYIITARRGSSLGPILNYLDEIGVDADTVRPIATAGESKGAVIANMIAQKTMADGESNIKRVEYYEDSDKNIQDVMNHICPDKLAELIIYKVVKTKEGYSLQHIGC